MVSDKDIKKLSFETAIAELEQIVGQLEEGETPLDQSVNLYERGDALRRHCDGLLKKAQARVEKIQLSADGEPEGTVPLD